ncbi:DUF222 domain-containing protein [Rhodococcus opacus]|nr:DUF222 domain-containing protein [Rhodococcus opacus]
MGDNSSSAAALDATPPGIVAVEGLRRGKSVLAQAQYRQVVAVTEFYDLCCEEDERRGINPAHSGSHASVEVSVALGINEPVVTAWIDLGLDLRHRLHGTRVAFAAGRIDLDQARVIAAILAGVSESKLEQLETAILDGRSLPPSELRARARRLIARHDPDSIARRNRLAVADRDVWIRPAENGMSYLDGHLPAADAHTLAMRFAGDVDPRRVCRRPSHSPPAARRRSHRLVPPSTSCREVPPDGTGHLTCHCGREVCPARIATAGTRRAPLVQVVVNASTLLGLDDLPADLAGYGPICADSVRTSAVDGVFQRIHTLATEDNAGGHVLGISPSEDSRNPRGIHPERRRQTRTQLRTRDGSRPPDQGPRRQLPLPQLPGPGAALRHRPHDAVRPRRPCERWSDGRVESRVPLPPSPPAEIRWLLDRPSDRRGAPRMDHTPRRNHPHRTRRGSSRTHPQPRPNGAALTFPPPAHRAFPRSAGCGVCEPTARETGRENRPQRAGATTRRRRHRHVSTEDQ